MPKVDEVPSKVAVRDGRVLLEAADDASLYIDVPTHRPLGANEPHATIRIEGDGYSATITLDAEGVDGIADILHGVQEGDFDAE